MAKKKSSSSKRTGKKSARKTSKKTGAKKSTRKSAKKSTRKTPGKSTKKAAGKTAKTTSGGKKSATGKSAGKSTRKQTKPKSPLSRKELRHFREILLEKRNDLVGDLTGIEAGALRNSRQEGVGDLSNMPTHPADIGSDNYEQEFSLGLMESERQLLKEIDEALERIAENTYGICLGTGKPIPKPRLEARPWARYCIEYARKIEQGLVSARDAEEDEDRLFGRNEDEDEDEDLEDEEDVEEPADDEDAEDAEDED